MLNWICDCTKINNTFHIHCAPRREGKHITITEIAVCLRIHVPYDYKLLSNSYNRSVDLVHRIGFEWNFSTPNPFSTHTSQVEENTGSVADWQRNIKYIFCNRFYFNLSKKNPNSLMICVENLAEKILFRIWSTVQVYLALPAS